MSYSSLADFLEELERLGQLRLVEAEVDAVGDPAAVPDALAASDGAALLFRNIRGCDIPLALNLLGAEARVCRALGIERLEELAGRVKRDLAKFVPRIVKIGSCQKVVRLGDDVDLAWLPVPCRRPDETCRLITAGQLVSRDPVGGGLVLGHAELSVRSPRELAVHWAPHEPLARLFEVYRGRGESMPLAVVLGGEPAWLLAAMAPLPSAVDGDTLVAGCSGHSRAVSREASALGHRCAMAQPPRGSFSDGFLLAGLFAGRPLDVVRCRTLDLDVAAEADIVLEGSIDPAAALVETGPVATPLGHLVRSRPAAVVQIAALTHRANPVFPAVVHGPGSREWVTIERAMQAAVLPLVRAAVPELIDCNLPECGCGREIAWASIRKTDADAARRVALALWELPATLFCKFLVIVDQNVDVRDADRVWAEVAKNADPRRDVFFDNGLPDPWDASAEMQPCRKMALDATS